MGTRLPLISRRWHVHAVFMLPCLSGQVIRIQITICENDPVLIEKLLLLYVHNYYYMYVPSLMHVKIDAKMHITAMQIRCALLHNL